MAGPAVLDSLCRKTPSFILNAEGIMQQLATKGTLNRNLCALAPLNPERASEYLADLSERAQSEELGDVVELLRWQSAQKFSWWPYWTFRHLSVSHDPSPKHPYRIASSPPKSSTCRYSLRNF